MNKGGARPVKSQKMGEDEIATDQTDDGSKTIREEMKTRTTHEKTGPVKRRKEEGKREPV